MNKKITLGMLVRNESDRYLERVLQQSIQYADHIVIVDDASEDNTVNICRQHINIPLTLVSNTAPMFHNEIVLRKQLYNLIIETNPDWIMIVDADELVDHPEQIKEYVKNCHEDYISMRLFDMWSETHYRSDRFWQAHKYFYTFALRNISGFEPKWTETPHHCGRFPFTKELIECESPFRIKHMGWSKPEDRLVKYNRYMQHDPNGTYGKIDQYKSILDENPRLKRWKN